MNTKLFPTLLLTVAIALGLRAADTSAPALTVALNDFAGEADAATSARNLTTLLTANLAGEPGLMMVERANLSKALQEQAMGSSGLVSADAAAQIGQLTGAKVVVAGQVLKIGDNHLVIVADIIGTETGRLFANKIEGKPDDLSDLTEQLSHKIAQTISAQATNLQATAQETSEQRLARITNSITGTNRPSVSVNLGWWANGKRHESSTVDGELSSVLLKSGFTVVDDKSDRKPDVTIDGPQNPPWGSTRQGDLYTYCEVINLTARERRTGRFITVDLQFEYANDTSPAAAKADAGVIAADHLAERILPIISQQKYAP